MLVLYLIISYGFHYFSSTAQGSQNKYKWCLFRQAMSSQCDRMRTISKNNYYNLPNLFNKFFQLPKFLWSATAVPDGRLSTYMCMKVWYVVSTLCENNISRGESNLWNGWMDRRNGTQNPCGVHSSFSRHTIHTHTQHKNCIDILGGLTRTCARSLLSILAIEAKHT